MRSEPRLYRTQSDPGAPRGSSQPRNSERDRPGVKHVANARGPFRTLLGGLELHGRRGRQTVQGFPRAGTAGRSAKPMLFPRIPEGDIILGAPICELCQPITRGAC
jgi:hypothetical protein